MAPLIVLTASFFTFFVLGALGVGVFASWLLGLRLSLALMFLLTASAHWGKRRPDLVRMVPPKFKQPELLVTLTGIAELAGAIGLLLPATAPLAAAGLALLLLAMFPANVHAARVGLSIAGKPVTALGPRTFIQLVFLVAVLTAGFAPSDLGS
jgi:uncharacterized membrane protein